MSTETPTRQSDPAAVEALKAYRAAVARVTRLREIDAQLPDALAEAEERMRFLASQLGLPSSRMRRRASPGERQRQVLEHLPGTARGIAESLGVSRETVQSMLHNLRSKGKATHDESFPAVWSRVESAGEATPAEGGAYDPPEGAVEPGRGVETAAPAPPSPDATMDGLVIAGRRFAERAT